MVVILCRAFGTAVAQERDPPVVFIHLKSQPNLSDFNYDLQHHPTDPTIDPCIFECI